MSTERPWPSWRTRPTARGVFLRKITRGATATDIPILPNTQVAPRRHRHPRRTHPGHRGGDQDAGVSGPRDRRRRRGVHRRGDRHRRAARRDRLQGRQRAAHAVHLRRRADCRPVLRMAALSASDLRADSVVHRLVHEFGRPERVHRRSSASRPDRASSPACSSSASACSSGASRSRRCP